MTPLSNKIMYMCYTQLEHVTSAVLWKLPSMIVGKTQTVVKSKSGTVDGWKRKNTHTQSVELKSDIVVYFECIQWLKRIICKCGKKQDKTKRSHDVWNMRRAREYRLQNKIVSSSHEIVSFTAKSLIFINNICIENIVLEKKNYNIEQE